MNVVEYDYEGRPHLHYDHIKISLAFLSRSRPEGLQSALQSVLDTCSNKDVVEILIKLDDDDECLPDYRKVLIDSGWPYQILLYPRYNGRWSLHYFQNDLVRLAHGDIVWTLGDDTIIKQGDWASILLETRDRFSDNIYVVQMPGDRKCSAKCITPAFSKEWLDVLGYMSPCSASDRFVTEMAKSIGRLICDDNVKSGIVMDHIRGRVPFDSQLNITHQQMKKHIWKHVEDLKHHFLKAIQP